MEIHKDYLVLLFLICYPKPFNLTGNELAQGFKKEEKILLPKIETAVSLIKSFVLAGATQTMSELITNNRDKFTPEFNVQLCL